MTLNVNDEILSLGIQNLSLLLIDRSTRRNIVWATDSYSEISDAYLPEKEMCVDLITGEHQDLIRPRILKSMDEQVGRTKKHAEVFTPAWVCNHMNNHCDEVWFGRKDVFNTETDHTWLTKSDKVQFDKSNRWKRYVDSRRLEITCGEAPFLVSRYDSSTGKMLDISSRIGILDRKLRVVNENTESEADWLKWSQRALESVYGYEYQGDNLLIARMNLLFTMIEYMYERLHRYPTEKEMRRYIRIITWNVWQMNGLTDKVPYCSDCACKVFDWRGNFSSFFMN